MSQGQERRVEALETRVEAEKDDRPPWVVVDSLADLDGLDLGGRVKVYVGFLGPDEWDEVGDDEQDRLVGREAESPSSFEA